MDRWVVLGMVVVVSSCLFVFVCVRTCMHAVLRAGGRGRDILLSKERLTRYRKFEDAPPVAPKAKAKGVGAPAAKAKAKAVQAPAAKASRSARILQQKASRRARRLLQLFLQSEPWILMKLDSVYLVQVQREHTP